jgi:circadian clock protein KaiC
MITKIKKIPKTLTGISGLDEITEGGLPKNRITLIAGTAGSGKTILAMEFLVKGATEYNEPGVFISLEESVSELTTNLASLGYNLETLIDKKKLYLEHIEIGHIETVETGQFNLEGLFIRLKRAIDRVGAKRVVLDSLDALFYTIKNEVLRRELNRLFAWLKQSGFTTILTTEAREGAITRNGLEEYIADCVLSLNNRITEQVSTRRLRIVKYRGSIHGVNEYPFTITKNGISVFPVLNETSEVRVSEERISSGILEFDEMLGGKGFFQGSSILVSGSAGTGKSSIAASLINSACVKKMRCLYCSFEENSKQITRNMASIGLRLEAHVKSGRLQFYFQRPTLQNLELHLIKIQKIIETFNPHVVILDPVTNIMSEGINSEIRYQLVKFVDFIKNRHCTILFTAAITLETIKGNASDEGISSMVDTWILLQDLEKNSERNRFLYVLKSRGMKHSSQVREFEITNEGILLIPVFIGGGMILTGSAKEEYENNAKIRHVIIENELKTNKREIERKRRIMEAEVLKLRTQFESTAAELNLEQGEKLVMEKLNEKDRKKLEQFRRGRSSTNNKHILKSFKTTKLKR